MWSGGRKASARLALTIEDAAQARVRRGPSSPWRSASRSALPTGKKSPGGAGTHTGTWITRTNLTSIPTHQRTRATARRPNQRPTQRPQPRSRPLPAADSEAAPCEPDPAAPRSTGGRFLPVPRPCQRQVKSSGLPRLPPATSPPGTAWLCWSTFDRLDLTSTVEFVTKRARTHRTRPLGSVGKCSGASPQARGGNAECAAVNAGMHRVVEWLLSAPSRVRVVTSCTGARPVSSIHVAVHVFHTTRPRCAPAARRGSSTPDPASRD